MENTQKGIDIPYRVTSVMLIPWYHEIVEISEQG